MSTIVLVRISGGTSESPAVCFLHVFFFHPVSFAAFCSNFLRSLPLSIDRSGSGGAAILTPIRRHADTGGCI
jgi:hypothetical protein